MNNLRKLSASLAVILVVAIVILLVFASSFFSVIDAGSIGIRTTFGSVASDIFEPGLHLKSPFTEVTLLSTRTQEYTMSRSSGEGAHVGDDSIEALTNEGLKVNLDVTVLYHLNADKATQLFKDVGLDYEEKVIRPLIRSKIREVVSQYPVSAIYSEKREEVQSKLSNLLSDELSKRGLQVENVLLRDVLLPEALQTSITQKLSAQQQAEQLNFEIDKAKKEAERKTIEAQGQRDAQKLISQGLTREYLQYLYIQNLKDLKGTIYVPVSPTSGIPLFKGL